MKTPLLVSLMIAQAVGHIFCPLRDVYTMCAGIPNGLNFRLVSNGCDPFDPSNPQCSIRLPNDPYKTCFFCCQQENHSFQKCSNILNGEAPTFPNGWDRKPIAETLCYEKGYVNTGEQLEIFTDSQGRLVNWVSQIDSLEDCIDLCNSKDRCNWWNYDPIQKACWLKKGKGNNKKSRRTNGESLAHMYTGHRDSTQLCQSRDLFSPAVYQQNPSIDNENVEVMENAPENTQPENSQMSTIEDNAPENTQPENSQMSTIEEVSNFEANEETNVGQNPTMGDGVNGRYGGRHQNSGGWSWPWSSSDPCPVGNLVTNCYDESQCIRCCPGGQPGNDGTPACLH